MRFKHFGSYRNRLLYLAIIPLVIFGVFSSIIFYTNIVENFKIDQQKMIKEILIKYSESLDRFFTTYENDLKFLASRDSIRAMGTDPVGYEKTQETIFADYQSNHPEIRLISLGTEDGSYYFDEATNNVPEDYDPRIRPWYNLGRSLGKDEVAYTEIYADIDTGKNIITLVKKVYDKNDVFFGVMGILFNLDTLALKNQENHVNAHGYTFITLGDKYFVHNNSDLINTKIENENIREISLSKESGDHTFKIDGKKVKTEALFYEKTGWTIWSVAFSSDIIAQFWNTIFKSLGLVIVILLVVLLITTIVTEYFVKDMQMLNNAAINIAKGNLKERVNLKKSLVSSNEFMEFTNSFNFMADMIEHQEEELNHSLENLHEAYRETVMALSNAIEASDEYTKGHCARVCELSLNLAKKAGLSDSQLKNIEYASLLHDIGKIGISKSVLNKDTKLTDEEHEQIKKHPQIGYFILKGVDYLRDVSQITLQHHEWYDGSGYPNGISKDEILIEARIISIADAYDSMTSSRPYRKTPLTKEEALKILEEGKNSQFDPKLVDLFLEVVK